MQAAAIMNIQPTVGVVLSETAPTSIGAIKTRCSSCNMREICLPCGVNGNDMARMDELVYTRKRIKRGQALYRAGESFQYLYAIRTGFFKSTLPADETRDQVTGFKMAGEILGMDGISSESHTCNTVALEDSEVCAIPFSRLEKLSSELPSLLHHVHKVMSREIVQDHSVMMLLGRMRAEERLAVFLLNLSQRFAARGYAADEFHLRMTREEIGSYLGLKLETVSRTFSKFHDDGLIDIHQKHIRIVNIDGLKALTLSATA